MIIVIVIVIVIIIITIVFVVVFGKVLHSIKAYVSYVSSKGSPAPPFIASTLHVISSHVISKYVSKYVCML